MAESTININRVYPPIVGSSIPAFLASDATLNIEFSLPKSLNYDDVKNISIKFTQQSNNKSVVNTDIYYDGIIYMEKPAYSSTGIYKITVNSNGITGERLQSMIINKSIKITKEVNRDRFLGYEYNSNTRMVVLQDGYKYVINFDPTISQSTSEVDLTEEVQF